TTLFQARGGRQHLSERLEQRLQELLQSDLGPVQVAHQAGPRQPRLPHRRRRRVLQLLRRGRRRVGQRLLQLRPRQLARRGAELEHRDERRLTPGGVAQGRSREQHQAVYGRLLAPPAVQLRQRGTPRRGQTAV